METQGLRTFEIISRGMRAQRIRMEAIANNLANMETTDAGQVADGNFTRFVPYRRRSTLFSVPRPAVEGHQLGGPDAKVIEDDADFRRDYNPSHPHAVKNPSSPDFGYLYSPNVNPMVEFVDMIAATRAYEAAVTAFDLTKTMNSASQRILA